MQCNLKIVNYLDLTLNLNDSTYRPYRKPDAEINYIHVDSNHPPSIIKQIPIAIEKRISKLSSNEQVFLDAAPFYNNALKRSGYDHELTYNKDVCDSQTTKRRKRKIIWFNPPYDKNVSTNIGKLFLNLIRKHFPKRHKFHKLFNKNTVKLSYSCMPSIKSIINAHNKSILYRKTEERKIRTCNCVIRKKCQLENKCLLTNVVIRRHDPGKQQE